MSTDPETVVRRFFDSWHGSYDGMIASLDTLSDECVWVNPGLPTTTTRNEAHGLMQQFRTMLGLSTIRVDVESIAVIGRTVHNERVDHLCDDDGEVILSVPIAGTLDVAEDGHITRWIEYFDPREALDLIAARSSPAPA